MYKATAKRGKAQHAVKVSKGAGRAGTWMDRERQELTRLLTDHPDLAPHLVKIIDHGMVKLSRGGEAASHRFLVLEWIPQTLAQWVGARSLPERLEALALAAEAVTRLHRTGRNVREGVAHRDIKPSNFLVGHREGRLVVKLSDFGGVKREGQELASWTFHGTPGFMPPDQILRRADQVDASWDVYATALTVFWCLTVGWDEGAQCFRGVLPASSALPTPPLTPKGQSLYGYILQHGLTDPRTVELAALPLEELVRLDEITPVSELDVDLLEDALSRQLRGGSGYPGGLARDLAEELADWLAEALQPHPDQRCPDARWIQTPCRLMAKRLRRMVAREGGPAAPDGASVDIIATAAPVLRRPQGPYVVTLQQPRGLWASMTSVLRREVPEPLQYPMAWIPPGTFMMGSPEGEEGRRDNETQHEVELTRGFWMGRVPVTQRVWEMVMGANPADGKSYRGVSVAGADRPVVHLSWFDAVVFCNALSRREGLDEAYWIGEGKKPEVQWLRNASGFRLPTEAEWEYAARAGSTGRFWSGDSEADLSRVGWYLGNTGRQPLEIGWERFKNLKAFQKHFDDVLPEPRGVGQKSPNPWGLHDVHGLIWEWCWDFYDEYPANVSVDPLGASTGSNRVSRGGSWFSFPAGVRVANRNWFTPAGSLRNLGLRLVRSL
ncbi:MAG: formylglycine-generating enzyme required for sulfatase activity/serine/threonine protein kinase [Myxococcota bacterium]